MPVHTTFSDARDRLANLWDQAEKDGGPVVIHRPGHADMVLIARAEWESMEATDRLLRSPRNAARLLAAVRRSADAGGTAFTMDGLRAEMGAGEDFGAR
ncbi:MAG: antitoxin YefM [Gemmatimonadetes bacterium]|nr:antitoxin YefM [Gemmatimonadota bacterium]